MTDLTVPSNSNFNMPRATLIFCTIAASWLLMQVIHESGHVLGAWLTGGSVRRVVLIPWELSRTDLNENPHPLFACWSGPIFGTILPAIVWLLTSFMKWKSTFWFRFVAGFCLIANGAYLGAGVLTHDGDAGDLIRGGSPAWTLVCFAVFTVPLGFFAWHCLGPQFGIGSGSRNVSWRDALISLFVLLEVILLEVVCARN